MTHELQALFDKDEHEFYYCTLDGNDREIAGKLSILASSLISIDDIQHDDGKVPSDNFKLSIGAITKKGIGHYSRSHQLSILAQQFASYSIYNQYNISFNQVDIDVFYYLLEQVREHLEFAPFSNRDVDFYEEMEKHLINVITWLSKKYPEEQWKILKGERE